MYREQLREILGRNPNHVAFQTLRNCHTGCKRSKVEPVAAWSPGIFGGIVG